MRVQDRQRLPQNAKEGNRSRLPSLMISLLVASVSPHPHSGCRLTPALRPHGNGDATEVNCDKGHDGVVNSLLTEGQLCPVGQEPHRDRQGLGEFCIALGS